MATFTALVEIRVPEFFGEFLCPMKVFSFVVFLISHCHASLQCMGYVCASELFTIIIAGAHRRGAKPRTTRHITIFLSETAIIITNTAT